MVTVKTSYGKDGEYVVENTTIERAILESHMIIETALQGIDDLCKHNKTVKLATAHVVTDMLEEFIKDV